MYANAKNQLPCISSFISLLKSEVKTEAYCALGNGKYLNFTKKKKDIINLI